MITIKLDNNMKLKTIFTKNRYSFTAIVDYDKTYMRSQRNLENAICNPTCNELMNKCYSTLYKDLVVTEFDKSIFSDTFLKLTSCCKDITNESKFIKAFKTEFKNRKVCYSRDYASNTFVNYDVVVDAVVSYKDEY
jgi:hypothetical protein